MAAIEKLAVSIGRRDEVPNLELARQIVENADKKGIHQLVAHLTHKDKNIYSDCIKVLYEIGGIEPSLISPYVKDFISLLDHKNNRMIWGAMAALNEIAAENPAEIYRELARIMATTDKGSVITRDMSVSILIKLCKVPKYAKEAYPLLFEQLKTCPPNQLPMYAENTLPVITSNNRAEFTAILASRLNDMEKETKRKRLEKVIKKLR